MTDEPDRAATRQQHIRDFQVAHVATKPGDYGWHDVGVWSNEITQERRSVMICGAESLQEETEQQTSLRRCYRCVEREIV